MRAGVGGQARAEAADKGVALRALRRSSRVAKESGFWEVTAEGRACGVGSPSRGTFRTCRARAPCKPTRRRWRPRSEGGVQVETKNPRDVDFGSFTIVFRKFCAPGAFLRLKNIHALFLALYLHRLGARRRLLELHEERASCRPLSPASAKVRPSAASPPYGRHVAGTRRRVVSCSH